MALLLLGLLVFDDIGIAWVFNLEYSKLLSTTVMTKRLLRVSHMCLDLVLVGSWIGS